jgi:hypothetical protein
MSKGKSESFREFEHAEGLETLRETSVKLDIMEYDRQIANDSHEILLNSLTNIDENLNDLKYGYVGIQLVIDIFHTEGGQMN